MNFSKFRIKIAKLYEKIRNKRMDNLHKISTKIISENQVIISEDLNIEGMVQNKHLSKSIYDVGWGN